MSTKGKSAAPATKKATTSAPAKGSTKTTAGKAAAKTTKGSTKLAGGKKAAKPVERKARNWKNDHSHLFPAKKRDYGIGRAIQHKRDVSRFVRWPMYVRLQRQRAILYDRLKTPPAINQFSRTIDKNQAATLFRLLAHYRPESHKEKQQRLKKQAKVEAKGAAPKTGPKPRVIKFGLNHVTELIQNKKAKLVVIAHDVDPVELVVWLPALCRKMNVPYCFLKGKARLGQLVHLKTASCIALTDIAPEHNKELDQLVSVFRPMYNDNVEENRRWGGKKMGVKHQHVMTKRARALELENAKKLKM